LVSDLLDPGVVPELLDHRDDGVGRLQHELGLAAERLVRHAAGVNRDALPDLLDLLGNAVEREREGLDVLAVQRGDEGAAERLGHLLADALLLAAGVHELPDVGGGAPVGQGVEVAAEDVDAGLGLVRAGLQQVEKPVVFSEESFEPVHFC